MRLLIISIFVIAIVATVFCKPIDDPKPEESERPKREQSLAERTNDHGRGGGEAEVINDQNSHHGQGGGGASVVAQAPGNTERGPSGHEERKDAET
uniref:Secreted protein n=1 Tax=Panagrolaimus sp. ES5 TaxID=591445 RepID=A0AC34GW14_9BILA